MSRNIRTSSRNSQVFRNVSDGLDLLRKRKGQSIVGFIYRAAKQNIPIDVVKNSSTRHKGTLLSFLTKLPTIDMQCGLPSENMQAMYRLLENTF